MDRYTEVSLDIFVTCNWAQWKLYSQAELKIQSANLFYDLFFLFLRLNVFSYVAQFISKNIQRFNVVIIILSSLLSFNYPAHK
jgi:hypothetical protein